MNVWECAIGITAGIMQKCQMGKQECEGRAGAVGSKGPRGGSGAQVVMGRCWGEGWRCAHRLLASSSWHLEEEAIGMSLVPDACGGCSERRM